MSNIFGGNTGLTYEQAQRKRQIADAMLAGIGAPRNVGEGLSAIGKALAFRGLSRQADTADAQGQEAFNSKWGNIVGALQGGQGGGGASYMPPIDPNSPQAIGRDTMAALGKLPGTDDVTSYIMQAASARGIDPSVAVEVARSEGLNANPLEGWQSNYMKDGKREESYGPFQLYMGGGLGNEFQSKTGLDPRDPMTWQQQVDFALDHAAQNGWGAWYGAGRVGIGNQQGIGGQPDMGALAELAGNPYANPGQQAVLQALLSQQIQGMAPPDPMKALELEKAQLELDAMRNPTPKDARTDDMKEYDYYALGATARGETPIPFDQWVNGKGGKMPAGFESMRLQALAAGLQEGTPEYQDFMKNGGQSGVPAAFKALHLQALAAGFEEGTPEYKDFMATRGAGLIAEAKAKAEDVGTLASLSSKMQGLEQVVSTLDDLSGKATYTGAGKVLDAGMKQLGMEPREAAVARAEYVAIVDNQILPLLRDTFGAQFTQAEGETLRKTLGDPDKSPQEKQAVLKAFIEQKRRDIQALEVRTGKVAPDMSDDEYLKSLGLQ